MEVKGITNRMIIMKARAMVKASVHKAYDDEDWWWESYLKKFITKLLHNKPQEIVSPNLLEVK